MGSKRKGLSLEDKRAKMLELFHEKKDFFQLKELEKMGPSEKGIIAQSVKDVVKSLHDDGLVNSDKIGSSIYFWSLPSQVTIERKRKLSDLEQNVNSINGKIEDTKNNAKRAKLSRNDGDERTALLEKLAKAKDEKETLVAKLAAIKDCDPRQLEKDKKDLQVAEAATERWKDNINSARSWLKNKFGLDETTINEQFGLPPDDD